jgi:hypothetical protein
MSLHWANSQSEHVAYPISRQAIERFRNDIPVTDALKVEKGHHEQYGWGVYFEQGRHRCILAGTVSKRPKDEAWEDTLWTACAEWASFMPRLGQPKIHQENPWTPDEFKHIFEEGTFEQVFGTAFSMNLLLQSGDLKIERRRIEVRSPSKPQHKGGR